MTFNDLKVGAIILSVSGVTSIFLSPSTIAADSHLSQQIKPFECIYTTTQTGGGSNMDSTCDGQPVPVLTSVDVNNGRPILRGTFDASRSIMLRVWINGQWYTLGIDSRLTTIGDVWLLDLSTLNSPLQAGLYTIVVEVETNDGLLLLNTDAGSFIVPVAPFQGATQPITQPLDPSRSFWPTGSIPTIMPRTQAPADLLGEYPSVAPRIDQRGERDSASTTDGSTMTSSYYMYIIAPIAAIVGALWFIKRKLHR